ncbi:hypothetical protein ACFP7A_05815 [Sporolactobacillus kofuensis]|uniref:Uncharacterized protein n=1 Tax=Sporolactobacillus kofuensis TaxID=269672 RepID=A0ABW1WBZ6_9BACL|nr:hypothetical protein [Sporolactobacillus kofuensis]MCO7175136.1 hypothetical protein [Sporolactobacillus kofuensis]
MVLGLLPKVRVTPNVAPIYNLNERVGENNKDINSSIIANPLKILENIWGQVANNPPTWGSDPAAMNAINAAILALLVIAAWALLLA